MEGDLARVQDAMATMKEARAVVEEVERKAEAKAVYLEVERTSLQLEIGAAKDEVSFLYSESSKDKEAMEEDY